MVKEEEEFRSRKHRPSFLSNLELDPSGKIVLLTTYMGAPVNGVYHQSSAQKIANATQKKVIAPTGHASPEKRKISSFEPFVIFHPSENDANANIFKEFTPEGS